MGFRSDVEFLLALFLSINDQPADDQSRQALSRMTGEVTSSIDELAQADLTSLDEDYLSDVFANV